MKKTIYILGLILASSTTCFWEAKAAGPAGVTPDTIKIGLFGPLSDPSSLFTKAVHGAAAVYKDVNDKGGINGRKIELIIENDDCDPVKGAAVARKLITEDGVLALNGAWCTPVALAVKAEIAAHPSVPYMVLGAVSSKITQPLQNNVFLPIASSTVIGGGMAEFALTKPHAKRIAIIFQPDTWGTEHKTAALQKLKEHGLEPVAAVELARGSQSAKDQVTAIKAANPDAVLAMLYPDELVLYMREAREQGMLVTTLGTQGVSLEDTEKKLGVRGGTKDLFVFSHLAATVTSPEFSKSRELLKTYYSGDALDAAAFVGMAGARAMVEALRLAGRDLSGEGLIAELNRLKDFDTGVLAGKITFTPTNHAGITAGKIAGMQKLKVVLFSTYPVDIGYPH